MAISEFEDEEDEYEVDEDWYDDDSGAPDDDLAPCPECGKLVSVITDKCPSCGYWFTEADHRKASTSASKPWWIGATALILVVALLAGILFEIAARVF